MMKLVALKCQSCGGLLRQISDRNAVCTFCEVGYLIDAGSNVPAVEEPPRTHPEVAQGRELLRKHDEAFARKMRAAGVKRIDGRWSVDSGAGGVSFCLGLLALLVLSFAGPAMAVLGAGLFAVGIISTSLSTDRADQLKIDIEVFYAQRMRLEANLADALRRFDNSKPDFA